MHSVKHVIPQTKPLVLHIGGEGAKNLVAYEHTVREIPQACTLFFFFVCVDIRGTESERHGNSLP